jgi:NADH-quinone oxidoreductase subunit H
MSTLCAILFLGGFWPIDFFHNAGHPLWFALKVIPLCFLFIFVRANYPRMRYDHLMDLGWKIFLPQTFGFFLFVCGILVSFGGLPCNFIII